MQEKELTYAQKNMAETHKGRRKLILDALPWDAGSVADATGLSVKTVRGHLKSMVDQGLVYIGKKERNIRGSEKHIYYAGQCDGTTQQGAAEGIVERAVRTQRNSIFSPESDSYSGSHVNTVGTHKSVWAQP